MRVFKDIELQDKLDREGYVKIQLAERSMIDRLATLYREVQPESYPGFSSTIYTPDRELKKKTSSTIYSEIDTAVRAQLDSFRPLGCSFLCKTPGPNSLLPTHQDWTVVDESKYASLTIWMPLIDTNEQNGALRVLPGSHLFSRVLRSPTLPGVFQQISTELYEAMISLDVKAGEAIVFNQALIHASGPNMSENDRVIATYGLVPEAAELCFYHREPDGRVSKYKIQDDFFITYNQIGSAPEYGEKMETFDYSWRDWTSADLKAALQMQANQKLVSKMKRLFKDDDIQSFFNKNGYAKFQILGEEEIRILHDYYYDQGLKDQTGRGFSMSMEDQDKEKVARIRQKIYDVALPKAMSHLTGAKAIAGSYVVKDPNPHCIVPPHQDWSFVDHEGEYYSVTCWIPLLDVNWQNGCMGVIKGSHVMLHNTRMSPSPQVPTPLEEHQFSLFPYLDMIEMKAGEALIFDHRTFHASIPNVTDRARVAIGLGFTQDDAVICHYTLKGNGKKDTLLKYYVDDAFLLKYDNALLSRMYDSHTPITGYEVAAELPFVNIKPTMEELEAMVRQAGNSFNTELATYMANLFGTAAGEPEDKPQADVPEPAAPEPIEPAPNLKKRQKSFLEVYTPMNILREIKYRLVGS